MKTNQPTDTRRKQILRALYEHGALSFRTLEKIIEPRISRRDLQKVSKRLLDKNLITPHMATMPAGSFRFYRLTRSDAARKTVGKWLGVSPAELRQPHFRGRELYHTEQCAIWTAYLKSRFPDAKTIRDFQLVEESGKIKTQNPDDRDMDLVPDILLQFAAGPEKQRVEIGIEIERFQKSEKRLVQKLRKLVTRTQLDGTVYFCEKGMIAEVVRNVFNSLHFGKSARVSHYSKHFILFSEMSGIERVLSPKFFNSELREVRLDEWVQYLRNTHFNFRRSSYFDEF